MLCTSCSKPVNPVVAVDIDGTLGDYHGHFIRFAQLYLGHLIGDDNQFQGDYGDTVTPFKDWFIEVTDTDERTWQDIKLAYRQGGMKRSMPAYDGAAELCHAIQDAGAELWLTTTRPYLRLDNVDPDTRFWLDQLGVHYDGLLYDELKYERLASIVDPERVVMVLDDLPEMINAVTEHFDFGIGVFRENQYNAAITRVPSVASLAEAQELVQLRIEAWTRINNMEAA